MSPVHAVKKPSSRVPSQAAAPSPAPAERAPVAAGYGAQRAAVRPGAATAGGIAPVAASQGVGYDAQRAAVRPTSKAAEVVAATKTQPPVDTHDGLRPAIKEVGGVVPFMKAMAGGQTVAGIGHDEFNTLWNRQENEDWLKDQFRAVSPNMHEWIPSNQMQAIVDKAKVSHEGPNWIDLHNELRSPTPHVIFHPSASSHEAPDGSLVLHGHVGAIYLGATPQIKSQGEFHDELREVFLNAPDVATAVDGLKGVMKKWVWDGSPLPKPLSPGLKDSMGRPLDPKALMADRAAKYAEMTAMFDGLKGKFGKPRRGK